MTPEERREFAAEHLARWRRRAVVRIRHAQGVEPEQIAEEVGSSLGTIRRDIHYVRRMAGSVPVTPELLINRRVVGEIDTPTLMGALRAWCYTASIYAPEWMDGVVPGTWAELEQARYDGRLSPAEYESLLSLRPDDETAVANPTEAGSGLDRFVPILDALNHHLAIRGFDDPATPPDACSCGRWQPSVATSWQEHVALEVLTRQDNVQDDADVKARSDDLVGTDLVSKDAGAIARRVRAVLAALWPDEIAPTARQQIETVLDAVLPSDDEARS